MKRKEDYFIVMLAVSCIIIPILYFGFMKKENQESYAQDNITNEIEEDSTLDTPGIMTEEPKEEPKEEPNEEPQKEPEETEEQEEEKVFSQVDDSYFEDALFIGDSRTVGLSEYGTLKNTTYFASSGMSIYNVNKDKVTVPGKGVYSLSNLLKKYKFGKIYVMLGINELGYNYQQNVRKYEEFIQQLQKSQPDAIIYIEANLHVTKSRADKDKIFNNVAINRFNSAIEKLADNEKIFYIDVNQVFDDKEGNLRKEYSYDGSHPLGKYYALWCDWLKENAIIVQRK